MNLILEREDLREECQPLPFEEIDTSMLRVDGLAWMHVFDLVLFTCNGKIKIFKSNYVVEGKTIEKLIQSKRKQKRFLKRLTNLRKEGIV